MKDALWLTNAASVMTSSRSTSETSTRECARLNIRKARGQSRKNTTTITNVSPMKNKLKHMRLCSIKVFPASALSKLDQSFQAISRKNKKDQCETIISININMSKWMIPISRKLTSRTTMTTDNTKTIDNRIILGSRSKKKLGV
jgi:hypothetical protein